ncbi:stage V sporulation protein D [Oxobacter pfennigii]|uniref:Stage V sporulation protein D n=1 Tax=Oxobacter pfennigii TaxID=36849 RepID=A0A0N8NSY2_9CLOT|nr:penicillin-binding transpeptidase domain-containing protein [Oxobacter pfennigii]KPU43304.1 stage V sporulation protein D [Oxobacter pfennigii]
MKTSKNPDRKKIIRRRMIFLYIFVFLIYTYLLGRLVLIQIIDGERLKNLAVSQWNSQVKVDAKRGEIQDRNGAKLALSASCSRVDVYLPDVARVEKEKPDIKNTMAAQIAGILGQSPDDVLKKLNATLQSGMPASSATIARRIDSDKGVQIKELKLPGIIVSEDTKRFYPNGNFLSQVLGFTNVDSVGQEGIELEYDKELKGIPGTIHTETDIFGRQLPYAESKYNAPVNGSDLTLTIDSAIQLYVEKALEQGIIASKAKSATAIVMNPKTGEVLAMSTKPDFDPNDPRNMENFQTVQEMIQTWQNKAVTFTYEPGSVFKIVTASAALSENIVDDSTRFEDPGYLVVAGRRIYNWNRAGNGVLDFAELLQYSSNVGFMMLGQQLGKETLYKYIDDFGFKTKTGIDVHFEESGYGVPLDRVGPVELANISFGQGIVTTPMQLTAAYAAIANEGKMMVPHIVKSITDTDNDGNVISKMEIQPKMAKQVVDKSIADKLMEYLETVITVGGGKPAYVEGYRIAGKTGTAQKAENGKYIDGKYVCTFIGMAPVEDPQFVVYVAIDEPDPSNYYAGQVVAPVAGQIFKDIFTVKNISPMEKDESGMAEIPDVRGLTPKDAEKRLNFAGFKVEIKKAGTTVTSVSPAPGTLAQTGSKVTITVSK